MAAQPSVLAAIDFGTFGSGYAWALGGDGGYIPSRDIYCNDDWPAADYRYPKNRSAVILGEDGEVASWGYDAEKKYAENPAAWESRYAAEFKMLLGSGKAEGARQIGQNNTGMPPERLIGGYLRKLYGMAREHIAQAGYDDSAVKWCLSVPAIWSDLDKQVMRRAAEYAGMPTGPGRLTIVLEPEVAALYCLASQVAADLTEALTIGRTPSAKILVVDCGGGTTDLVPLAVRPDGTFDQAGYATGDTSGASRVTQNFILGVLVERLGAEAFLGLTRNEPRAAAELRRSWEQARNLFDPANQSPVRIELSIRAVRNLGEQAVARLAAAQGGEDDSILISSADMRALLDSSVDPICALVDDQMRRLVSSGATPEAPVSVYLVGGFANSRYLQARLRDVIAGRAVLYVPPRPENAVLFGAVQYANRPDMINARTVPLTYGYGLLGDFDPRLDSLDRLYKNDEGTALCVGRFRTLVHRGELVPVGTTVTSRIYPRGGDQREVTLSFYASKADKPRYVDDEDVTRIGVVKIVLPDAGRRTFRAKERAIDVLTIFGETTIRVQAIDTATGFRTAGQIEFAA